jgi:cytochrome P450
MRTATSSITSDGPPILRGHFLFGNMREGQQDPLRLYMRAREQFGDIVRLRTIPSVYWYLVTHPHDVEHVLQINQRNYRKPDVFNNPVGLLTGRGLLTSEGDFWRHQRRLAQPAFHRQRLAALATLMTDAAESTAERWSQSAANGTPMDIAAEMMRLTLKITSLALFSNDISDKADRVGPAVRVAFEHVNYRMSHPLALPERIPTRRNRRFLKAKRTLDELVFGLINEHRRTGEDRGDLLSMLLLTCDEETGEGMSDQQLRDEVITLLLAGHETTAAALSWIWYLLSLHPDIDCKLHAELAQVLGGRTPTFDDLPHLSYTAMVCKESMRLYPPAWGQPRQAIADDRVGGYHIPAGVIITLCQWVTHRHPDFWETPEQFDPERFTPERSANRPRFAYFPFGGGARQCIGNNFAMMEAQLILATLAQRFRLDLVPKHPVEPDPTFTLRPRYGVLMTLHRRSICNETVSAPRAW